jgi:hypothetical protein
MEGDASDGEYRLLENKGERVEERKRQEKVSRSLLTAFIAYSKFAYLLSSFYPFPRCLQHLQSILYVALALRPQSGLWRYCHSRLSISVCLKYGQNCFLVGLLRVTTEYESWMLCLRVIV